MDLLSVMDRGFVLGLVRTYYKLMSAKAASLPDAHAHALVGYKIDLLRIVLSYEHLIALSLPLEAPCGASGRSSPSPSIVSSASQSSLAGGCPRAELTPHFRSLHFLVKFYWQTVESRVVISVFRCVRTLEKRNIICNGFMLLLS